MISVSSFRNSIERKKGERDRINRDVSQLEKDIRKGKIKLRRIETAQTIVQTVAQQTQEKLQYHISELVSLALGTVFPDPYQLQLEFVIKRGKTEADLYLIKNGEKYHPLSSAGGGVVDITSFALRIALWSLRPPRTRNTLILDEPFRFLSRNLQPKAGEMLKQISERLGIQIIMVSHNEDVIESADKVFQVTKKKGVMVV